MESMIKSECVENGFPYESLLSFSSVYGNTIFFIIFFSGEIFLFSGEIIKHDEILLQWTCNNKKKQISRIITICYNIKYL